MTQATQSVVTPIVYRNTTDIECGISHHRRVLKELLRAHEIGTVPQADLDVLAAEETAAAWRLLDAQPSDPAAVAALIRYGFEHEASGCEWPQRRAEEIAAGGPFVPWPERMLANIAEAAEAKAAREAQLAEDGTPTTGDAIRETLGEIDARLGDIKDATEIVFFLSEAADSKAEDGLSRALYGAYRSLRDTREQIEELHERASKAASRIVGRPVSPHG